MLFATFLSVHPQVFFAEKSNKKKIKLNVKRERGLSGLLQGRAMSCRQSCWQLPAHFSLFPPLNIQHLSLDLKALYQLSTK